MVNEHSSVHFFAAGSLIAAGMAHLLNLLPYFQLVATLVGISSGLVSMYFALKRRGK